MRRRGGRKRKRETEMVTAATNPEYDEYTQKHIKESIPLEVETNLKKSRVASMGYTGLDDNVRRRSDVALEDLLDGKAVGRKFTLQEWDAKSVFILSFFRDFANQSDKAFDSSY
jgi:hypothetical protein